MAMLVGVGLWGAVPVTCPCVPCVPCPRRAQNMYRPVREFFQDILNTQNHAATDVYAYMFMADVVDFIIIIFGFWAFGVSRESHRALTVLPPPRG